MRDAHEQCSACLQLYVYELEVRCVVCDSAGCQFCAVRVDGAWTCVSCKEEPDADARDVES
jgi:hypothetical protein